VLRIVCDNVWCRLENGHSKHIRPALRVKDPRARFRVPPQMRYSLPESAMWKNFYNKPTKTFPAGLLPDVQKHVEKKKKRLAVEFSEVSRKPISDKVDPSALFEIALRPDQLEDATTAIRREKGVFSLATNYGKSVLAAAIAYHLFDHLKVRTVVIVPNTTLLRQTAEDFRKFFGARVKVGQVGDGVRTFGDVTFITQQTAVNASKMYVERRNKEAKKGRKGRRVRPAVWDKELSKLFHRCDCIIYDELHHAAAVTGQYILMESSARFRFGMSGTVKTNDPVRDMTMRAFLGPVLADRRNSEMMDKGISARIVVGMVSDPKFLGDQIAAPRFKKMWKVDKIWGVKRRIKKKIPPLQREKLERDRLLGNRNYNKAITLCASEFNRGKLKPLVITTSLPHLGELEVLLKTVGLTPYVAWGKVPAQERLRRVAAFENDPRGVLLGNVVFDEGLNAPSIGVLILASGGASVVRQLQRVGRAVRRKKKGINYVYAVDFWPTAGEYTAKHAKGRLKVFKHREGFEVQSVTDLVGFLKKARNGWQGILGQKRYERVVAQQNAQSSKR